MKRNGHMNYKNLKGHTSEDVAKLRTKWVFMG